MLLIFILLCFARLFFILPLGKIGKENLNLPLLTEEMNGAYYARARQNTSVASVKLWRRKDMQIEERWLTYSGIVLEKAQHTPSPSWKMSLIQFCAILEAASP